MCFKVFRKKTLLRDMLDEDGSNNVGSWMKLYEVGLTRRQGDKAIIVGPQGAATAICKAQATRLRSQTSIARYARSGTICAMRLLGSRIVAQEN